MKPLPLAEYTHLYLQFHERAVYGQPRDHTSQGHVTYTNPGTLKASMKEGASCLRSAQITQTACTDLRRNAFFPKLPITRVRPARSSYRCHEPHDDPLAGHSCCLHAMSAHASCLTDAMGPSTASKTPPRSPTSWGASPLTWSSSTEPPAASSPGGAWDRSSWTSRRPRG